MANNLLKIRGEHQISQTALAKAVGITKQGLCLAEKGKCSVALAKKVAEYLHEDVIDILGTDIFVIEPQTEEEKEKFIKVIREL